MGKTKFSVVEYRGERRNRPCGYCKSIGSKFSHGMWAHSLNVEDYQQLIDRGWRRSGHYCYKPIMRQTCCPQYTIRCNAHKFKFSKSKKKVSKRMQQFVMSEGNSAVDSWRQRWQNRSATSESNESAGSDDTPTLASSAKYFEPADVSEVELSDGLEVDCAGGDSAGRSSAETPSASSKTRPITKEIKKGLGPDPTKPRCRKAKEIRLERKLEKRKAQSSDVIPEVSSSSSSKDSKPKTLEDSLVTSLPGAKHKLQVKLVRAGVGHKQFDKTLQESLELYQKYQCSIHNDDVSECDEKQWKRFLVESPLNFDRRGPGEGFGTFHNQYWLDDKLIAVGVLDILPRCVSSVYLYYDPDYGFLSLGVYSALNEIALTKKLHSECASLEYYYMGYYIHSCPKMRYKGAYEPSELLCPETYHWVPLSKCVTALDKQAYARLNVLDGGSAFAADADATMDAIGDVRCLWRRSSVSYQTYKFHKYANTEENMEAEENEEDDQVRQYVSFIGKTCAKRMLLFRAE